MRLATSTTDLAVANNNDNWIPHVARDRGINGDTMMEIPHASADW